METGFRLVGRYRLQERIGSGGMAEVWRARDEVLGRHVAVKLVNGELRCGPAFHRHFRDEARAAAGLSHPRIVAIFDFGEAEAWNGSRIPYLVMEFLEGETLAQRIQRGPLPVAEAVHVCAQIAEAIAAAHHAGIVHHDVKPSNVFLTPNGVKVIDFGIARAIRNEPAHERSDPVLATEPLLGTPGYVAPEQFGRVPTTPAVDVYAFGVVLTECLTGRRAIDAPLPSDIPVEVAVLCTRSRSSDPLSRPSAAEAAEILALAALKADLRTEKIQVSPSQEDVGSADAMPEHNQSTPMWDEPGWCLRAHPYAQPHTHAQKHDQDQDHDQARKQEHVRVRVREGTEENIRAEAPHNPTHTADPTGQEAAAPFYRRARDAGRPTPGTVAAGALVVATVALAIQILLPATDPGSASAGPVLGPTTTASTELADPPGNAPAPADNSATNPTAVPTAGHPADPTTPAIVSPTLAATPAKTIEILTRMRPLVDEGFASGEIRSDVAIDLNNVVNNLQNELVGGQQVDLGRRLTDLHNKIATRLREGGLTVSRAEKLNAALAGDLS